MAQTQEPTTTTTKRPTSEGECPKPTIQYSGTTELPPDMLKLQKIFDNAHVDFANYDELGQGVCADVDGVVINHYSSTDLDTLDCRHECTALSYRCIGYSLAGTACLLHVIEQKPTHPTGFTYVETSVIEAEDVYTIRTDGNYLGAARSAYTCYEKTRLSGSFYGAGRRIRRVLRRNELALHGQQKGDCPIGYGCPIFAKWIWERMKRISDKGYTRKRFWKLNQKFDNLVRYYNEEVLQYNTDTWYYGHGTWCPQEYEILQ